MSLKGGVVEVVMVCESTCAFVVSRTVLSNFSLVVLVRPLQLLSSVLVWSPSGCAITALSSRNKDTGGSSFVSTWMHLWWFPRIEDPLPVNVHVRFTKQ